MLHLRSAQFFILHQLKGKRYTYDEVTGKMNEKIRHLYIHVPFCATICSYCDFCHLAYNHDTVERWLKAFGKELEVKDINRDCETIYIGGGTPSCLGYDQLERLLELLKPYASSAKEYTIEINPETVDEAKINIMKEYGINRVSIGVQARQKRLLELMNRHHDDQLVEHVITMFRDAGITNISCDIMYSLPGQSMDDLKDTVEWLAGMDIPHLSLYSLTVEENTVFGKKGYRSLDEDTEADMYEYIRDTLKGRGYDQYEISNYCLPDMYSRHNMGYWDYDDFYGLSMGASGKEKGIRYANTRKMSEYEHGIYISEKEELSERDQAFEMIMMGLRKREGVNLELFEQRFGAPLEKLFSDNFDRAMAKGYIEVNGKFMRCTDDHFEICNTVILEFMD